METLQKKLSSSARAMEITFKVTRIALFVGLCIAIVSIIFIAATNTGVLKLGNMNIMSGIAIEGEPVVDAARLVSIAPELAKGIVWAAIMVVICYIACALFHETSVTAQPFTEKNISRLRKISGWLIGMSVAPYLAELVASLIFLKNANTNSLIDMTTLVVALLFFCLAHIFEYGMQLQKQSDETL